MFTLPASEAFAMVADGRINNGTIIICLQWLQLNHEAVRREWA